MMMRREGASKWIGPLLCRCGCMQKCPEIMICLMYGASCSLKSCYCRKNLQEGAISGTLQSCGSRLCMHPRDKHFPHRHGHGQSMQSAIKQQDTYLRIATAADGAQHGTHPLLRLAACLPMRLERHKPI